MKKTIKRILAMMLCTVMVLGIVPAGHLNASAASYDPAAAVSYANSHYNDGKGLCAEFVSACLNAGGCTASSTVVSTLQTQLKNGNWGTLYKLAVSGQEVKSTNNSGKVAAGDPIFFYCNKCGKWPHVAIVNKIDSSGIVYCDQHNPAYKDMHYLATYKHCSQNADVYSFHMTPHTHSYSRSYEAAHPHRVYMQCSCGDYYYTGETTKVSGCVYCETYTISYNGNGATSGSVPASQTKSYGTNLTLAQNTGSLAKTGYTLDGWSTSASGAKAYDLGGTYTANASVSLYAHWAKNTYTAVIAHWCVGFNGKGTNSYKNAIKLAQTTKTFTYESGVTFTKDDFISSYSLPNGVKIRDDDFGSSSFSGSWDSYKLPQTFSNVNKAVYIEMCYALIDYSITYDMDGGTLANANPSTYNVIFGATFTNKPSKPGYIFAGWTIDGKNTATGINEKDLDDSVFVDNQGLAGGKLYEAVKNRTTGDINVKALWIPAPVTGISIKTMPTKTTYTVGESFDQSGLTLMAEYSDNSTQTVTSGFTCSSPNLSTAGTKTITVTYQGKTTTFTVTVNPKPVTVEPVVAIHNYTATKTVDYKTTVTFSADVTNPVSGASVHWFIDGQDKGTGEKYTVTKATESFTVQAKYIKDGKVLAESGVEKVSVKTGFFAKLLAFFRSIFGALPKVVQGYMGAEIVEKFLP